jgi:hypothetical protein
MLVVLEGRNCGSRTVWYQMDAESCRGMEEEETGWGFGFCRVLFVSSKYSTTLSVVPTLWHSFTKVSNCAAKNSFLVTRQLFSANYKSRSTLIK